MVERRQNEQGAEDLKNDLSVSSLSFLSVSYVTDQVLGKLDIETPQCASLKKKKKNTIKPENQNRSGKAENFDKVTAVLQPNTIRNKSGFTPAQISKEQAKNLKLHPCQAAMRHLNLPIHAVSEKASGTQNFHFCHAITKSPIVMVANGSCMWSPNFFTITSNHSLSLLALCKRRPFTISCSKKATPSLSSQYQWRLVGSQGSKPFARVRSPTLKYQG